MSDTRVVLVGRDGCHLCDAARVVVRDVCDSLGVGWEEWSLDDRTDLPARYGELVPVVLVDGREHAHWRVDASDLRRALAGPNR